MRQARIGQENACAGPPDAFPSHRFQPNHAAAALECENVPDIARPGQQDAAVGNGTDAVIDQEDKSQGEQQQPEKPQHKPDHIRLPSARWLLPEKVRLRMKAVAHRLPRPAGSFNASRRTPAQPFGGRCLEQTRAIPLTSPFGPSAGGRVLKWRRNPAATGRPSPTRKRLLFHSRGRPGKLEVVATKPMATQRDLSLAYSPGVAVPVLAIAEDEAKAYDYTTKGNFVAVITNGTAILGLGNLGALAAKPVMEGKAVLFKRFADIDSIDLEVSSEDPDEFINCVKLLGARAGAASISRTSRRRSASSSSSGCASCSTSRCSTTTSTAPRSSPPPACSTRSTSPGARSTTTKLVCNGAGAAGIACLELLRAIGFRPENLILCDTKGVIYEGRTEGMNQWKSALRGEDLGAHARRRAWRAPTCSSASRPRAR